jgi:hypothetical protein
MYSLPYWDVGRVFMDVRSPYRTYVRHANLRGDLMYMAWEYEEETETLLEEHPQAEEIIARMANASHDGRNVRPRSVTVSEWYDTDCRLKLINGEWTEGLPYVEHKWGFVPGRVVPNITGVGIWGASEAQQMVHLAQLYSELLSMMQDGMFRSLYDPIVIFDDIPIKKIDVGQNQAIQLSSKAHTGTLRQGVKMPEATENLGVLERLMRLATNWPLVMSSEMNSDIVSGKAFVAAQGPVAARAATKQILNAKGIEATTSFALKLYEKCFPRKEVNLLAVPDLARISSIPNAGRMASEFVSFVPKRDINGRYTVICTYPPAGTDRYRQTVEHLQMVEAELLSKETVRQFNPAIDSVAEKSRIEQEFMDRARRQAEASGIMFRAQAQAQMEVMMQQQQAAMMAQMGAQGPAPAGPAGPPAPEEGGSPLGIVAEGRGGPMMGAGGGAGTPPPEVGGRRATLNQVQAEFLRANPIRGRVFLMGAIVVNGFVDGQIEVGLTDMIDKGTLVSQTVYGQQNRLLFHKVAGQGINMVEVTTAGREVA